MQKFPKVFTIMSAILALAFCLASCKANADDDPTMYTVTVSSSIEHGTVTADKSSAEAGATIKLTATADSGYELESYSVKDASENALTVTDGTFTMPESNVTVSATFKAKSSSGTTSGGTEKQAGSISYSTASVSKTTDDAAFTNTLTKTGDGTVTYASSKETVATVNATTGEVTIVGAGETTITATVADSDTYTYATKTASYTLTVTQATTPTTYIGTKAPTEAKAVGDIVFSDGSATAYTSELTLTDEQKSKAVAVIFYAGSASDTLGEKTLGVGLKNATGGSNNLAWAKDGVNGFSTNITAIQCTPIGSDPATATFTDDLDGSDNWQALCDAVSDEDTSGNYPAWEWVNAYATKNSLEGSYANGWYLPTLAELSMLYRVQVTVNSALEKADGTKIANAAYWSSSQYTSSQNAWEVWFGDNYLCYEGMNKTRSVCTVRAF